VITEYFGEDADERFQDGWLRTSDMSVMEPGGYLRIVDRSKDLVTSGGEWISSIQLESLPLTSVGKVDRRTIRALLDLQLDGLAGECLVDDLHRVQRRCPG
jgi:acyl-CoA synthetase (AMP-forming)/AMP-acid ligase II